MSFLVLHKQDIVVPNCDPATWEVGEELKPAGMGYIRHCLKSQTNEFSAVFGGREVVTRQLSRPLPEQLNRPIRTFSHESHWKEPQSHTFLGNGDRVSNVNSKLKSQRQMPEMPAVSYSQRWAGPGRIRGVHYRAQQSLAKRRGDESSQGPPKRPVSGETD